MSKKNKDGGEDLPKDAELAKDLMTALVADMEEANRKDREQNSNKKLAIERFKILNKVES